MIRIGESNGITMLVYCNAEFISFPLIDKFKNRPTSQYVK